MGGRAAAFIPSPTACPMSAIRNSSLLSNLASLLREQGGDHPNHTPEQRAAFAKENDWDDDTVIKKTGFATPPGSSSPNDAVADKCAATLSR